MEQEIDSYFVKLGFVKCRSQYGIYVHVMEKDITIIYLYFDDLIVIGNDIENLLKFKELMKKEFEMSNLGNLSYFLDI